MDEQSRTTNTSTHAISNCLDGTVKEFPYNCLPSADQIQLLESYFILLLYEEHEAWLDLHPHGYLCQDIFVGLLKNILDWFRKTKSITDNSIELIISNWNHKFLENVDLLSSGFSLDKNSNLLEKICNQTVYFKSICNNFRIKISNVKILRIYSINGTITSCVVQTNSFNSNQ